MQTVLGCAIKLEFFLNFHAFFSIAVTVLFTSQIVLFTAICKESKQPSVNFSFPAVKKTPVFSTRGENSCFLNSWKTEVNSSSHEVPQLFVFLQGSQKLWNFHTNSILINKKRVGSAGIRTRVLLIWSRTLYQLSYFLLVGNWGTICFIYFTKSPSQKKLCIATPRWRRHTLRLLDL